MSVVLIIALSVTLAWAVAALIARRSARHRASVMLRVAELERENYSMQAELNRRARVIDELRRRVRLL